MMLLVAVAAPASQTLAGAVLHMVPMRDGTKLATYVYLPQGEGRWPAILVRTPYKAKSPVSEFVGLEATRKGYACVVQDVRGMHDSEGHPAIIFLNGGWGKRQDGYDTVEWIARQEWCNGKIGTWGMSALGITQVMMAPSAPPHLTCQHVTVAFSNMYPQCAYQGGAWRKELIEVWLERTKITDVNLETFIAHPAFDAFWEGFDAVSQASKVEAPVMFVGGWYDCFAQGTIDGFVAFQEKAGNGARGKCKLVLGPWAHGEIKELKYPNAGFPKQCDHWRWLGHYLKGEDNGVAEQPAVYYYVMGDPDDPKALGNEWREAAKWPPPSTPTPYYLQKDGRLGTGKPEVERALLSFRYDPANPVPTVGGQCLTVPVGPKDQREVEKREDVLVFTTPELAQPCEVTGRIKAKLWASSSARDTDFTAKLCDVYPDGRSMLVTDGILRMRYRESFRRETLAEPDKVYPLEIDLWSTSLVFNAGHRIRVSVSSSNSPRFEPNPNTGAPFRADDRMIVARNVVYMDREHPSHIILPVVKE